MRTMLAGLAWLALPAFGEVLEVDALGFVSGHAIEVDAVPQRVFEALTAEIGDWWDPAHTYSGDAANLELGPAGHAPSEQACLCERLVDGGYVVHMRIDAWRPGRMLRLSGGLGPLQALGVVGSMTFELEATHEGTRLIYRYAVTGRGISDWAEPVDRVQRGQLARLARYLETGSPTVEADTGTAG